MPATKETPTARGEGFICPCGGEMDDPDEIKPRLLKQDWTCSEGCRWERDFSQGGPEWREASE